MPPAPPQPRLTRPLLPLWAAVLCAAAGGLLLSTAFPALAWWPMVFVAVPLALMSLIGRRIWSAGLVGLVFGLAFFLVNVSFTARYLGPVPWLALSIFEAVLTAVAAIPITLAYRWLPRVRDGAWARLVALPALVAALWVLREQLLGTWPYGGFPWGRVGITQAASPLAEVASWVGVAGLSFLIVFVCASAVEWVRLRRYGDLRTAIPGVGVLLVLVVIPQFPTTDAGSLRVGAVQGNGPAGYFDARGRNDVLNAQLQATAPLFGEDVDVLLWPEGGVDSDPTTDPGTATTLDALTQRLDAPLVVAAVTQRGDEYFNSSLLWEQDADNPVDVYDKRHPVPFGEFVPDRWLYRQFAPDLIDLIQREYTPGGARPFFDVDGVGVGLAICFDVIYDDVVWDGAQDGAELFMFQTNNADFRGTDENLQQLAFARMRAVETGRSVVNISTVGTSQIIAPDGSEIAVIAADTAGHMLEDVPLRTGLTPAVIFGGAIQLLLVGGAAAALIALGVIGRIRPRNAKTPTP
ncbi:apolipoprotein N-acyltransferase [Microbacterium timonense]|uniref:apolipoprotein N-acyltransferase n=1 Tax=Microbacterium timonense TaxID=2086576 RepID=UPI00190EC81A|nr:apolipoprotein N-acyltransferase [Microbacterium timonense]